MADRLGRLARHAGALIGLALAVMVVPVLSTGCLYLIRPHVASWPGPRITDALALDAIPHEAGVPLVMFVVIVAAGSLLLGLICRSIGLNRVSASLVLLTGVGLWSYLLAATSIFLVLQVPAADALRRAASSQATYAAATLAGLAGALLTLEPRKGRRWLPFVVYAVTVDSLLALLSVVIPRSRGEAGVVGDITTGVLPPTAAALMVPVAILLFITSRGLGRRNRTAWRIAVGLLGLSIVLDLLHGLDVGDAIVSVLVLVLLVARRHDFTARTDPEVRMSGAANVATFVAVAFVFGFLTLVINRVAADLPVHLTLAAQNALGTLVGLAPSGHEYLHYDFGDWLPWAVVSIEAVGLARGAMSWTAPWRERFSRSERDAARATEIVRRHGTDTLSPFALRADKDRYFFEGPAGPASDTAFVAYRVVRGVAIIAGDPVGPAPLIEPALRAFLGDLVRPRGWKVVVLGASSRHLGLYRELGLRSIYHGDEALLDVKTFSLEGPPMRTVRQAVHRVERKGFGAEVHYAHEMTAALWLEVTELEAEWLHGRPKTGFVMQLDDLSRLGGTDALFVLARRPDGAVGGFLHIATCPASRTLSLSSMPRRLDNPNGLNAFLIASAAQWARENGFTALSLNFSPFAGLLGPGIELSGLRRIEARTLLAVKRRIELQLDNLHTFNRQFAPHFEPRYVAVERRTDLPRALMAMMAAEGYLPFAARVRGRSWSPSPSGLVPGTDDPDPTPAALGPR